MHRLSELRAAATLAFAFALALGTASTVLAESSAEEEGKVARSGPRLRFNPFEEKEDLGRAESERAPAARSAKVWEPVLRATLAAGDESLVDLGGVVLTIGEETHGYKLLAVREFSAVFERAGVRVELELERGAASPASRGRSERSR